MMPAQPVLQGVTARVHARLSLLSEVRWVWVGLGDTGEPVVATRDKEQQIAHSSTLSVFVTNCKQESSPILISKNRTSTKWPNNYFCPIEKLLTKGESFHSPLF